MRRPLQQWLLVSVLTLAIGGHWALLQTVAWTNMLATNLRTDSLEVAVIKTFDGQHPCNLCKVIAAGKKSEKRTEFPATLKRLEFISARPVFVFAPPQDFRLLPELEISFHQSSRQPPVPPPRNVAI
jgi:hypothetical protein